MEAQYYKERLGFDPPPGQQGSSPHQKHQNGGHPKYGHPGGGQYETNGGYEESLSKFKGEFGFSPVRTRSSGRVSPFQLKNALLSRAGAGWGAVWEAAVGVDIICVAVSLAV